MAESTAKSRLRWFQFSVGMLLILMTLSAVPLAAWRFYTSRPNPELEEIVQVVLHAASPEAAHEAYRMLFKAARFDRLAVSMPVSGLAYLKGHRNASIAVQAAWEELHPKGVILDPRRLKSFLTFLEKRAGVRAPKWWAEMVLDARGSGAQNQPPWIWAIFGHTRIPVGTTLSKEGDKIVFRAGSDRVVIPEDVLKTASFFAMASPTM